MKAKTAEGIGSIGAANAIAARVVVLVHSNVTLGDGDTT